MLYYSMCFFASEEVRNVLILVVLDDALVLQSKSNLEQVMPYNPKKRSLNTGEIFLLYYIKVLFSLQGGRIKMRSPPKVLTGNFRPSQLSFFLS